MIIRRITANDSRFRGNAAVFETGLNVVLADRHRAAKERQTTNGAGKTTLLEIVHYCLGRDVARDKGCIFAKPQLSDWEFTVQLEGDDQRTSFSRRTADRNTMRIECLPECAEFMNYPSAKRRLDEITISRTHFSEPAGCFFFDLPVEASESYRPKFRALLSYLVRLGKDAFLSPFANSGKQQPWDEQACTAFLLGLNPAYAGEMRRLKDKEDRLKALTYLANSDERSAGGSQSTASLFARVTRLRESVEKEKHALASFKVLDNYEAYEQRANELTVRIHDLVNDNIVDEQLIGHYELVGQSEVDSSPEDIARVYHEAGLALPEHVTKTLDDIRGFHATIVSNRKRFVEVELSRLREGVLKRRTAISELTEQRASVMGTLADSGALRDFAELERRHSETLHLLSEAESAYGTRMEIDSGRASLRRERLDARGRAEIDLREREELRRKAVLLFNENSQVLYESPGDLLFEIADTGFRYGVEIERARSAGVGNMKVFCYDLMLMQLPRIGRFPRFLVHDSPIFEGVDGRQKAKAIELAAAESQRLGFQYIMAINRDDVPWSDFSPGFERLFRMAVRLELSDQGDGGLLGFQV